MSLEAIYNKGRDAFLAGEAPAANPFYRQTDHGKAWAEGYEDARGPLPKIGPLEFHAMTDYGAAFQATKTHRLSLNRFGAVGAVYFRGHRVAYVSAVGATRREALKAVLSIIDPDPYAAERSERRLRRMGG